MSKKRLLAAALCAVVFRGLSAGSALAGEVTGKPPKDGSAKPTPIGAAPDDDSARELDLLVLRAERLSSGGRGRSDCGARAELGQIPKDVRDFLATIGEHPGDACNGHSGHFAGG